MLASGAGPSGLQRSGSWVEELQAELMWPIPFRAGRLGEGRGLRAYAVLQDVAKQQGGREDKGGADPEHRWGG